MRAAVLAVAAIVTASATAHAGSGLIVPPMELATGLGAPIGGGTAVQGATVETLAGIHWASFAWRPTHFDVGVGYVGSSRGILPGYGGVAGRSSGAPPTSAPTDGSTTNRLRLDGGYLELGRTLAGSTSHWRTWISARGELLHGTLNDQGFSTLGAALRVSSELYVSGGGGGGGGGFIGTLAVGLYVEASHREIAPELGPTGFTSGVQIRIPFIAAN